MNINNIKIANRIRKQAEVGLNVIVPLAGAAGATIATIPTGLYQAYKGIRGLLGGEGTHKYGIPALGSAAIGEEHSD